MEYLLIEIIVRIITVTVVVFGVVATFIQYTSGRLISKLEFRLHYFSTINGERVLHIPPIGEPKVWEVFDTITALWILFRARSWAKKGTYKQILEVPSLAPRFSVFAPLFPSKAQMLQRVRFYLQTKVRTPMVWVQRASNSVNIKDSVPDETEYQFFLAVEHNNPEANAIYVYLLAVDTVDEIVASNGAFADTIHPHWSLTDERVQILNDGCKHLQKIRHEDDAKKNIPIWL